MVFSDDNVGFGEELLRKIVDVSFRIDDLLDPRVDEYLGTHRTGVCGGVDGTVLDAHTEVRGLNDRVLFSMDSPA